MSLDMCSVFILLSVKYSSSMSNIHITFPASHSLVNVAKLVGSRIAWDVVL